MTRFVSAAALVLLLLIPTLASADYLGCHQPGGVVSGATADFDTETQPTSANYKIYDPNDTTSPTLGATALNTVDATNAIGQFRITDYTVPASPLVGLWTIRYYATYGSVVHHGVDVFEVKLNCGSAPQAMWNVVDLTNEAGDQNPTVSSFDTDLTQTVNIFAAIPSAVLYFPTTLEEPRQNTNCNLQAMRIYATAFNTTTKVVSTPVMPAAPDYRCGFWIVY